MHCFNITALGCKGIDTLKKGNVIFEIQLRVLTKADSKFSISIEYTLTFHFVIMELLLNMMYCQNVLVGVVKHVVLSKFTYFSRVYRLQKKVFLNLIKAFHNFLKQEMWQTDFEKGNRICGLY